VSGELVDQERRVYPMIRPRAVLNVLLLGLSLALIPSVGRASLILGVSLDTSPLVGNPAGPFALAFTLIGGSGVGDANNTVTISNFSFGGGGPSGTPDVVGGASGDLSLTVTLTDSAFFNDFVQEFTPGSLLAFILTTTTNVDPGGIPDTFAFSILDGTGLPIPTLDPTGADSFLSVTFDDPGSPAFETFPADPNSGLGLGQPSVQAIPEPSSLFSGAIGLTMTLGWYGMRRRCRAVRKG
jgi:hypothetical protein